MAAATESMSADDAHDAMSLAQSTAINSSESSNMAAESFSTMASTVMSVASSIAQQSSTAPSISVSGSNGASPPPIKTSTSGASGTIKTNASGASGTVHSVLSSPSAAPTTKAVKDAAASPTSTKLPLSPKSPRRTITNADSNTASVTAADNNSVSIAPKSILSKATKSSKTTKSTKSKSSKGTKSTKSSTKSKSSEKEVAAIRNLRSIVEASLANGESIPPTVAASVSGGVQPTQQITNFDQLIDQAEKRLHFNEKTMDNDPLGLLTVQSPKSKNKGSDSATVEKNADKKKKSWFKFGKNKEKNKPSKKELRNKSALFTGALETLEEDTRGDADQQREVGVNPVVDSSDTAREGAPPTTSDTPTPPVVQDDDNDTAGTCTDSIIDLRLAASQDYVASVCSLRSLGTFEKDFLNNIIAEQAVMEEVSVSTFEQDFIAKQARGENVVYPTQVFATAELAVNDDLTVDNTVLSETTFERDARGADGGAQNVVNDGMKLPMQVTTSGGLADAMVGDDDDITVGTFLSETTFERDQRKKVEAQADAGAVNQAGSAPTTLGMFDTVQNYVKNAFSAESQLSVSTFEKDTAALAALAAKIGRKPSTSAKKVDIPQPIIATQGSERSCSTFEQDAKVREEMKAKMKQQRGVNAGVNALGLVANPSEQSNTTFEKDYHVRSPKPQLGPITETVSRQASNRSSAVRAQLQPQQPTVAPIDTSLQPLSPLSIATSPGGPVSPIISPPSNTAFETDTVGRKSPSTKNNNTSGWKKKSDMSLSGFEKDVAGNMNSTGSPGVISVKSTGDRSRKSNGTARSPASVHSNKTGLSAEAKSATAEAEVAAKAKLPKISPLVVELSPNAIDRGVKKSKEDGGLWGKFLAPLCTGGALGGGMLRKN